MVTLSQDGYVRMTLAAFENIPLEHFWSGLDDDSVTSHSAFTDICTISGYTEWKSSTQPVISVGWDWRLDVSQGRPRYLLVGSPRSNVMFQNASLRDLGHVRTASLIKSTVDSIPWQKETVKAIRVRYSATT